MFNQNLMPYSDLHTLNLDWILQKIKDFEAELSQIEDYGDRITALENGAADLQQQITTLESNTQSLYNVLHDSVVALNTRCTNLEDTIDARHTLYNEHFESIDNDLTALFQNYTNVLSTIVNMEAMIHEEDDRVLAAAKTYADGLIQQFIEDFPELYELYVKSPVSGQTVTVQVALDEIYETYRFYAIDAATFDHYGYTAQELDGFGYTALELDTNGLSIFKKFSEQLNAIRNPWYGDFTTIQNVIYRLLGYHIPTLSASERDALDLTAQQLDDRDYTAYYLDWGVDLGRLVTCADRDNAAYTAQQLDDLQWNAAFWDSVAG